MDYVVTQGGRAGIALMQDSEDMLGSLPVNNQCRSYHLIRMTVVFKIMRLDEFPEQASAEKEKRSAE